MAITKVFVRFFDVLLPLKLHKQTLTLFPLIFPAMFRKFHPEHFVCAFCLKQLNKGTFKEQNDKPYCHQCFDKLFG